MGDEDRTAHASLTRRRGSEAYSQAYEYVAAGSPGLSARRHRRLASRYLAVTASPPLTVRERFAAIRERSRIKREAGRLCRCRT